MKIIRIRYLSGPNIYHNLPVTVLTLDLESLADTSSTQIAGFIPRLLEILPGLNEHSCSLGYAGGFVERLGRGTYFAHIIEHIGIELSGKVGIPVTYGKSVYGGKHGVYHVIVRSKSERGMAEVMRLAVDLADSIATDKPFLLEDSLTSAKRIITRTKLGPSTQGIVDAALRREIPVTRLNDGSLVQLGYGKYRRLIEAAVTSQTSAIGLSCAKDKSLTKKLLAAAAIPVPIGDSVLTLPGAIEVLTEIGRAVVVKPEDGNHGRGITLNVTTAEQMIGAFENAKKHSGYVIVEELFNGQDYRILVVDGKMVAAALRTPAQVVGDGKLTVAELVEKENLNPDRGFGHESPMTKIDTGIETVAFLARQNLTLVYVPAENESIVLAETANMSTGGSATDVTDDVHGEIRALCERAARSIGLDICGIDLIAKDISQPLQRGNGILEINAGPGLRMHIKPSHGKRREVGDDVVKMLYPEGSESRIPIVAITGTNGKTTVTRLISHILLTSGKSVGTTTTGGIFLNGEKIASGDTTGPNSARTILMDSQVEVAVLETARGGIIKRGLGFDWSDVGVVTNIQPDHIGQDGIESIEDIIRIKSLIPERVKKNGTVVLNADDPNVLTMMENPRLESEERNLVYFSLRADNAVVRKHVLAGGRAFVLEHGEVVELRNNVRTSVIAASSVPLTSGGVAEFQIANVLAATAACRALNIPLHVLRSGLSSFSPNRQNLGRGNLFRLGPGYVMVDYGHNPAAFRAVQSMAKQWGVRELSAVLSLPGDRKDELLTESATIIAETFGKLYLRRDRDQRGRATGDANGLIIRTLKSVSPSTRYLEIPDELQAIQVAVKAMVSEEVLTIFYDDEPSRVLQLLREMGAEGVDQIAPIKLKESPFTANSSLGRV